MDEHAHADTRKSTSAKSLITFCHQNVATITTINVVPDVTIKHLTYKVDAAVYQVGKIAGFPLEGFLLLANARTSTITMVSFSE